MGILTLLATGLVLLWFGSAGFLYYRLRHPVRRGRGWALVHDVPADPEALGMEGEAITLRFRRGTETRGWVLRGDKPDLPLVLMTHGFGDCRVHMLNLAVFYVPHASAVVVYDVAAHGDSTDRALTFAMREPFDVSEIIEQLPESMTARGVVLAGCSMGGVISVRAALLPRVRARLRGVVLDGPYRLWWEPIHGLLRWAGYPAGMLMAPVRMLRPIIWPGVNDIETVRDAARVEVPLMVLHGELDPVCPVASGRQIAGAAPRGRIVTFAEGHHLDLAAIDPDRYDASLRDFFATLEE
ncbi:alpha/beta hydrolase [Mucisphaera calidilacus]|uniref:Alpha/beta hydrolase family protein n=1 Tax=Mucisphaera calidilacus TaxID=2527982 RepID=A0A518BZJ9_9BACT|nr:alpha/beta fold hydrolase [Mucisphaera calidilacus]QDU72395.1 Alpha/beta hydrolase family protein [Mucisphaera calidilacus]